MLNYCKLYKLKNIRVFDGWNERYQPDKQTLLADDICYLWNDFTVGVNPLPGRGIIFDAVTPEWQAFCKTALNFEVPSILFSHDIPAEVPLALPDTHLEPEALHDFIPMLPIHLHCLAIPDEDPHIFNMTTLWEIPKAFDDAILPDVVQALLRPHEALRSRFMHTASGWQTYISAENEQVPVSYVTIARAEESQQTAAIEAEIARLQTTLNLFDGPLIRVARFHLENAGPDRLLFIVHHFVCDDFSYNILIEDFLTAYQQINRGMAIQLPATTTSIKDFARRLETYAQAESLHQELSYWVTDQRKNAVPIPVDYPQGVAVAAVKQFLRAGLSKEETDALRSLAGQQVSLFEILLTTLFQTHLYWTGKKVMLVEIMNLGRDSLFDDVDLLRTMGWINHITPLLLNIDDTSDLKEILFSVKEQYNAIPNTGIGYSVLRYLDNVDQQQMLALPSPQLYLNYLGKRQSYRKDTPLIWPAKEAITHYESQRRMEPMRIKIYASIVEDRLEIQWEYQSNLYRTETIDRLNHFFLEVLRTIPRIFY